jgi:hypothetical protein
MISRRHLALLSRFTGTQLLVQAFGFVGAIVLLRAMAPADYALYTLVLSFTSVAAALTDLGLGSSMLSIGARWLTQPAALAGLLRQAQALHRRLTLWALAPLLGVLTWLLLRQDAAPVHAAVLAALVALTAWAQVRGGVALALVRLRGHTGWQQRMELSTQAGRLGVLLLLAALAAWWTLDAAAAAAVNLGLAAAAAGLTQRHLARDLNPGLTAEPRRELGGGRAPPQDTPQVDHRPALREQLWRQGPNAVYYVVNAQVALWLLAVFGQSEVVAQAGALGRLAAVFGIVGSVSAALLLPYFARRESAAEIRAGLRRVHAFYLAVLALLVALALAVPEALLWVLGRQYADLQRELVWMVVGTTLAPWAGTVYSIGCARGWVPPLALVAGAGLGSTVLAAACVDVASLQGGLLINCAVAATGLLVGTAYVHLQLRQHVHLDATPA